MLIANESTLVESQDEGIVGWPEQIGELQDEVRDIYNYVETETGRYLCMTDMVLGIWKKIKDIVLPLSTTFRNWLL